MSRDFVTIIIVLLCVAALVFLIFKTVNLSGTQAAEPGTAENFLYNDEDQDTATGLDSTDYPLPAEESGSFPTTVNEVAAPENDPLEGGSSPVTKEPAALPRSYSAGADYLVLAGSYRVKSNAESEVRRLQRLGYADAETTIFNRGAYATVLVDRFSDPASARSLVNELKSKHGIDAYVQKKKEITN